MSHQKPAAVPYKHKAITPPLEWARAMALSQQMKRSNLFTYILELEQRLEKLEAVVQTRFAPPSEWLS